MYDERFQTEHCTTPLSPLRFNVYLLLPIHVLFYCSLRLAPGWPASTLVYGITLWAYLSEPLVKTVSNV